MEIIPFQDNSQWQQQIELDGTTFILTASWNALNEYWSLNIYDQDFNPIVLGIKVVTQFNLTKQVVKEDMPLGQIVCQNIVGGFFKIKRNDMGETNELVYYEESLLPL